MKLGVFDSGLGGLLMARSIRRHLPNIDIIYFGDTLHLPYGNRSVQAIYDFSRKAMDFLFEQDCNLIITACNTVSASALRPLQQQYLPEHYPDRRILGVVVPTLECALERGYQKLGVIATNHIFKSKIYETELKKLNPDIEIYQQATPLLVPLIENNGMKWIRPVLEEYLDPLLEKEIECLILGCTHYPFLKQMITDIVGIKTKLISQDEIIPAKLEDYLQRHPEINDKMSNNEHSTFYVSDVTESYINAAHDIYGSEIKIQHVTIHE